jgi:hypothetical protein
MFIKAETATTATQGPGISLRRRRGERREKKEKKKTNFP